MQSNLARAISAIWPTLNFADRDGTLANVRYDDPLPDGFVPPTQQQIDDKLAELALPAVLKRKQIMCQLDADAKLDAAFTMAQQAGGLIYQRWFSDDWALADLQAPPFATMIAALGIDLESFWARAAQQPV